MLGGTLELIFAEKAAVIKGGDAVFGTLSGLEAEARRVCSVAGALPHFLRDTVRPGDLAVSGSPDDFAVTFAPAGRPERWAGLRVPTPALYQVENAALAVAAVRLARSAAWTGRPSGRRSPGRPSPAASRWSRNARSCWLTAPTIPTASACWRRAWPRSACRGRRSACSRSCATRTTRPDRWVPPAARRRGLHPGQRTAQPEAKELRRGRPGGRGRHRRPGLAAARGRPARRAGPGPRARGRAR